MSPQPWACREGPILSRLRGLLCSPLGPGTGSIPALQRSLGRLTLVSHPRPAPSSPVPSLSGQGLSGRFLLQGFTRTKGREVSYTFLSKINTWASGLQRSDAQPRLRGLLGSGRGLALTQTQTPAPREHVWNKTEDVLISPGKWRQTVPAGQTARARGGPPAGRGQRSEHVRHPRTPGEQVTEPSGRQSLPHRGFFPLPAPSPVPAGPSASSSPRSPDRRGGGQSPSAGHRRLQAGRGATRDPHSLRKGRRSPASPRRLPEETTQWPDQRQLARDRRGHDGEGGAGVPTPGTPGCRRRPRAAPASGAAALLRAAAPLAPPLPHPPGLTRRGGYSTRPRAHRSRTSAHARPVAASSPPLSSPRSASRRPLAHLHASAQPSAEGGCTGQHPGASVPTRSPNPGAPRAKAPPPPACARRRTNEDPAPTAAGLFWCAEGRGIGRGALGLRREAETLTPLPGYRARPIESVRVAEGGASAAEQRTQPHPGLASGKGRTPAPSPEGFGLLRSCLFGSVPCLLFSAPQVLQHGVLQIEKDFFPFLVAFKYLKYNNT